MQLCDLNSDGSRPEALHYHNAALCLFQESHQHSALWKTLLGKQSEANLKNVISRQPHPAAV